MKKDKGLKSITTLDAWRFIESILPGDLPKNEDLRANLFSDYQKRPAVLHNESYDRQFWKEIRPKEEEKYAFRFRYYAALYNQQDLTETLRNFFNSKEAIINKVYTKYYSYAFDVNELGEYVEGSLFIPHLQLILADIERQGIIGYSDFSKRYNEYYQILEEDAIKTFKNGLNEECFVEFHNKFSTFFSTLAKEYTVKKATVKIFAIKKPKENSKEITEDVMPEFNSFFLDDLYKIGNQPNRTLQQFIEGVDLKVDINENRASIEEMLQPKNLPNGRWPSFVQHRLSLMQQVAVNQVLNGKNAISSVNGPPGTGKTTLLKDIFADLIVQRAQKMAAYSNPMESFSTYATVKIGDKELKSVMLAPEIAAFSMVVASCNNGAVENISKDLPKKAEVSRSLKTEPTTKYEKWDTVYANEAEDVNFFSNTASIILGGEESWGLFSAAFGKSTNIKKVVNSLFGNKDKNQESIFKELNAPLPKNAWHEAVDEFHTLLATVEMRKVQLQQYVETMQHYQQIVEDVSRMKERQQKLYQELIDLEQKAEKHKQILELLKEQERATKKPGFFAKLMGKQTEEQQKILQKIATKANELEQLFITQEEKEKEQHQLNGRLQQQEQKLEKLKEDKKQFNEENVELSTDEFWQSANYEERQKNVLWQADQLNFERGLLFLKALKVHKYFMMKNSKSMHTAITIFANRQAINTNTEEGLQIIRHTWKILHLLFPLMSTTFASFGRMYKEIGADFIDYLFIDEAGQASPQQAAGALWRSKHAIVVGDPIQIEPVVTLDAAILSDVRKKFGVSEQKLGTTASVQVMADLANPMGTLIQGEMDDMPKRLGIPLWVHRRCLNPMFSIANDIAYNNQMVIANDTPGKGQWFDSSGKASTAQYVPAHGELVVRKFKEHVKESAKLPSLFIITPFTAVKKGLKEAFEKDKEVMALSGIKKWLDSSIGTVHTFQGKEADIVYFITGTDKETDGAAEWSCQQPNLLNVAATRAKKEFYVIGEKTRFSTKKYYKEIIYYFNQFN